jgi:hypothetical protein
MSTAEHQTGGKGDRSSLTWKQKDNAHFCCPNMLMLTAQYLGDYRTMLLVVRFPLLSSEKAGRSSKCTFMRVHSAPLLTSYSLISWLDQLQTRSTDLSRVIACAWMKEKDVVHGLRVG